MADKPAEQMKRVTRNVPRNVTPLDRRARMYYVECEKLVPHKFLVAVPADSAEAACRLADGVIRAGRAYGVPDFSEARPLTVDALKSAIDGDEMADRLEPVPDEWRIVPRYSGA